MLGIIKDLGYKEPGTIFYKDPTTGMFTLSDDISAQKIDDLCKVHMSVHMYV